MISILSSWYRRHFSNEEAVVLVLILLGALAIVVFFGRLLAPVLTALVLAYLMVGLVQTLHRRGIPYLASVLIVYCIFIGLVTALLLVFLPLIWRQLTTLLEQLPSMVGEAQRLVTLLPEQFPDVITRMQVESWIELANQSIGEFGTDIVSFSVANLPNAVGLLIFVVLVPVLVFFFLKDKDLLISSFIGMLPRQRPIIHAVWLEMDQQIANYVRGKFIEIVIVGSITYFTFVLLDLRYAALLGFLVGISVIVPFIGAALVTIPVAMVGYFQFGLGSEFAWVMIAYAVIQALDGNVIVPLIFSEAVNLHPVAIIVAVLVFGGFWGLWGVFFAIPLATLIKAVFSAWPTLAETAEEESAET